MSSPVGDPAVYHVLPITSCDSTILPQKGKRERPRAVNPACGRLAMKERLNTSRSKAIARLIRDIVMARNADTSWLSLYVPNYKRRLRHYESGDRQISLDAFIDLMTALRCEVVVIPMGKWNTWYRLNDFPDNNGNVLKMPDEVKKGRKKKRE